MNPAPTGGGSLSARGPISSRNSPFRQRAPRPIEVKTMGKGKLRLESEVNQHFFDQDQELESDRLQEFAPANRIGLFLFLVFVLQAGTLEK